MNEKLNPLDSDDDLKPVTPERRKSESSTERSQYALEDAMKTSTPRLKTYGFYYTKRHTNLKVCDEQKNVIYFSNVHEVSSSPDVVLHHGPDKHAPVVAVAQFRWSRDLKLGLGNPQTSENDVVWEEMKNLSKGIGHSKYRLEMTIDHQRRSFLWQRTRDSADGVEGVGRLINWNYKLVDERTGEVLAVYLENFLKGWLKKGKLQLKADLGREWELMVLLGSLGLCEKASRRARQRWWLRLMGPSSLTILIGAVMKKPYFL
jgi:hypothetical protein